MKKYDYVVIGSGVGGCNIAYRLKESGFRVALIDKEGVALGASGAAGAFLSPLPGKANPYNTLINQALEFSLDFYEQFIPKHFVKNGLLRVENENFNATELKNSDNYISNQDLKNSFKAINDAVDGYFYKNAAIVEPLECCLKLAKDIDFYKLDVKHLDFQDDHYIFDGFISNNIILAQGIYKSLIDLVYIKLEALYGVKLDIKTSLKIPFNIHKNISISTTKKNNLVSIGATKQRHSFENFICDSICDKCTYHTNSDEAQIDDLLSKTKELLNIDDLEIVKVYKGARSTIKSYFPIIGEVVDFHETLKHYPSIKNGTKIPPNLLSYYKNIYIINALGSRGFVLAPYLADILLKHILEKQPIPFEITTTKLFYKKARN